MKDEELELLAMQNTWLSTFDAVIEYSYVFVDKLSQNQKRRLNQMHNKLKPFSKAMREMDGINDEDALFDQMKNDIINFMTEMADYQIKVLKEANK